MTARFAFPLFAAIAQLWLLPVSWEHPFCSLCNFKQAGWAPVIPAGWATWRVRELSVLTSLLWTSGLCCLQSLTCTASNWLHIRCEIQSAQYRLNPRLWWELLGSIPNPKEYKFGISVAFYLEIFSFKPKFFVTSNVFLYCHFMTWLFSQQCMWSSCLCFLYWHIFSISFFKMIPCHCHETCLAAQAFFRTLQNKWLVWSVEH